MIPYSSLNYGNCLHASDGQSDGLVRAQLRVPPHGAHLNEEAHDVVTGRVSVQGLLRLPVLNQLEVVGVDLPLKLIVYKPRTFLNTRKWIKYLGTSCTMLNIPASQR